MNWFGELPAHWGVKRVRHIGTLKGGAGFPHERQGRQDGELPFFKVKDLGDAEMPLVSTDNYVSRETATELRANVFPARTIVFAKVGAALMLNRFRILGVPGCIDNNMMGLTIDEGVMTVRFALSALALIDFKIVANPGAVPSVNEGQVSDYPLPVPPLSEQLAIANFLDRETARVDELVAAKQRVLDLLAEKRKAIIATAVTRGLDPNVKLRDSGVPWLGEIPEYWHCTQLRRFMQFITSGSRGWADHYSSSGSLFLRIGNLRRDSVQLDLSDIQHVEPPKGTEGERTRVLLGDLLFSITAYLGSIAVIDSDIGDAYVSQHVALVRLDRLHELLPHYAAFAVLSHVGQAQLVARSYGGTKMQLALDDIRELWLPLPPLDEQRAIVAHITHETAKIDAVRAATERTIALLKERRAALIAAAVTGQLDLEAAA